MDKQKVEVKGEGLVDLAQLERGIVPLAGVPILRAIPSFGRKVSFLSEDGRRKGGIKLPKEEWPLTVLQRGDKAYLISQKRESIDPKRALISLQYLVRTAHIGEFSANIGNILIEKPKVVGETTTITNEGKVIADFIYDGNNTTPTLVFHFPLYHIGYGCRLSVEYTHVNALDLKSNVKNNLTTYGTDIETVIFDDKKLVGITVPASKVPELIEKTKSSDLERAFDNSDLERVVELNRKNDRDHRPNCWGDHSCIPLETFELVEPRKYPKYRVSMDTKGKIYKTERIIDN